MYDDSWPAILFVLFAVLAADSAMFCGATRTDSPAHAEKSGLGLPRRTLFSFCLSLLFAACSAACFQFFLGDGCSAPVRALLLSLFLLCLGALFLFLPHYIGFLNAERLASRMPLARTLCSLFRPLVLLITAPAELLVRARSGGREPGALTEENVRELVDTAEDDVIAKEKKAMIGNIFALDDAECGDISIHRTEITAVSIDATVEEVVAAATETGFSRLPVYEGSLDHILGVYHVKDLLPYLQTPQSMPKLSTLMRPVLFVPEGYKAIDLLRDFRQNHSHIAVVVDEYGGTSGIVTLEDILESIVGDIEDEYDEVERLIAWQEDGSLLCDGYAEILDVFEALHLVPPQDADEEYATIGGLVTDLLGYIPKPDEQAVCHYGGLLITVTGADERRVTSVHVAPDPEAEQPQH